MVQTVAVLVQKVWIKFWAEAAVGVINVTS
jgi:hypothetical protein